MSGFESKRASARDKLSERILEVPLASEPREELIQYLIDSDFQCIMHEDFGPELLDSYLDTGFKGYRNFTDQELAVEYQQREEMK